MYQVLTENRILSDATIKDNTDVCAMHCKDALPCTNLKPFARPTVLMSTLRK